MSPCYIGMAVCRSVPMPNANSNSVVLALRDSLNLLLKCVMPLHRDYIYTHHFQKLG
jgi:hypothetical protein